MKSNSRVLRGWRDFGVKATAIILTILLATQMVGTPAFASGALTNKQTSEDIATTVDDTGVESSGTEATDTTVPDEAAGTESDPAPADSTQATEEPVVETTESATDPATETPAADPAANTVLGTESEPAPAVEQDRLASIKLDLADGASITLSKDGNKIDDDTNPVDVPANEELKFTAQAAEGWQIDKVKTVIDGVETELTADANGEYKVAADKVTDKLTVKVEAVEVAEDPAADATETEQPEATDEESVEGDAIEEDAEESTPEMTVNEALQAIESVSLMSTSARAAGGNSWTTESHLGVRFGSLSIAKHFFEGQSTSLGSTSYELNTVYPSTVNVEDITLEGYEFVGAYYNGEKIARLHMEGRSLQYSTNGSEFRPGWKNINNVGNIVFYYKNTVPATGIEVTIDNNQIVSGDSTQAHATLTPSDATDKITWSSSDSSVATVNQNGKVTGQGVGGVATITATTASGLSGSVTVTVSRDTSGDLSQTAYFYLVYPGVNPGEGKDYQAGDWLYGGKGTISAPQASKENQGMIISTGLADMIEVQGSYFVDKTITVNGKQYSYDADGTGEDGTFSVVWDKAIVAAGSNNSHRWDGESGTTELLSSTYDWHVDGRLILHDTKYVTASFFVKNPGTTGVDLVGGEYQTQLVEIGGTAIIPDMAPTKGYGGLTYTFDGWYKSYNDATGVMTEKATEGDFTNLKKDVNFYARYVTTVTYTYTHTKGGNVSRASETLDPESGIARGSTATAEEGYAFDGWYVSDTKITADNAANFNVELKNNGMTIVPKQNDKGLYEGGEFEARFISLSGETITIQVIKDGEQVAADEYVIPSNYDNNTAGWDSKYNEETLKFEINYAFDNLNCADIRLDMKDGCESYDISVDSDKKSQTTGLDGTVVDCTIEDISSAKDKSQWKLDNIPSGATITVTLTTIAYAVDYKFAAAEGTERELDQAVVDLTPAPEEAQKVKKYDTAENLFFDEPYGPVEVKDASGVLEGTWTFQPGWNGVSEQANVQSDVTFTGYWTWNTAIDSLHISAPEDVYYNGLSQEQAPVVTDRDGNPIDPSYYDVTYSEDTVNAGTVTITVTGKNGYTGSTQVTYNILKVDLTIATPSAGKVFDGAPLNGGQPTASGWQDDDAAQVTLTATGSITNVGSAYNTYTVSDPDGVLNNYNIIDSLGVLTVWPQSINPTDPGDDPDPEDPTAPDPSYPDPDFPDYDPADPDPEGPDPDQPFYTGAKVDDPESVPYDGNVHQWTPTVTDNEGNTLTPGEDYTVSYSTDDFTNVGTITVTITGTGNYGGSVDKTYQITPAQIVVNIENQTKVQGSADPTFTFNYSGVVEGETMAWTGEFVREVGEAVGDYAVTQGGFVLADNPAGGFDASNYTLVVNPGTLTITAATTPGGGDEGGDDTPTPTPDTPTPLPTPDTPGTPGTPIPVPTPALGGGGVTPADGLTATTGDDAEAEEAIDDEATPLTAPEPIDDGATPLAANEHRDCWVHWLMLLGILVTVVYYGGVGVRRVRFSSSLQSFEDDVLGNNETNR